MRALFYVGPEKLEWREVHPEKLGETAAWDDAIDVLRARKLKPVLMRSPG